MMERAWKEIGGVKVPVLYLYGAHDQIIPKRPAFQAASRLKPGDRTAYYANGWHLMTRDKQGPKVWEDIATYIFDPAAPLPSNPPPIPGPETIKHGGKSGL
jgi:esterase/lipase